MSIAVENLLDEIQISIEKNQIGNKDGLDEHFLDLVDEAFLTLFEDINNPYSNKAAVLLMGRLYFLIASAMIAIGKSQQEGGFEKGGNPRIYKAARDYLHLSLAYQLHAFGVLDESYCIRIPPTYLPSEFYQNFLFQRPRAFTNLELVFKNLDWADNQPEINPAKIAVELPKLLATNSLSREDLNRFLQTLEELRFCLAGMKISYENHVIEALQLLNKQQY